MPNSDLAASDSEIKSCAPAPHPDPQHPHPRRHKSSTKNDNDDDDDVVLSETIVTTLLAEHLLKGILLLTLFYVRMIIG